MMQGQEEHGLSVPSCTLRPGRFPSGAWRCGKRNHVVGHGFGFLVPAIGQAIGDLQDPVEVMSAGRCLPEEGDVFDGLAAHIFGSRGWVVTSTPVRLAPWGVRVGGLAGVGERG